MSKQCNTLKSILFLIPFVILGLFIVFKIFSFQKYRTMVLMEDGLIEYCTALIYFFSSMIAISIYFDFRKIDPLMAFLSLILAAGFLFICLEEISYGQRILNISTPSFWKAINKQKELNLHNTLGRYPLHFLYVFVGFYGIFSKLIIKKILKFKHRIADFITPDYFLISYFFPVFILYIYYDYLSPLLINLYGDQFIWAMDNTEGFWLHAKDQEAAEFILSLGFILFTVNLKFKHALTKKNHLS
jgi:hypothetical protein